MRRILRIDVCDYTDKAICNIYDSLTDTSGSAKKVFISSERNGWKELSFEIPSVCETGEGLEENYRLAYLVAEYRLRTIETKNGKDITDWFVISEPSVDHKGKSKNISVTAGHFSQNLKTKQTNMELSDEEGNNVGTCDALLATILGGTNWKPGKVAKFFEDNGVDIKVRSLTGGPGSNAFQFITDLCELFDAKPVFNGDRTVDILPMNPFSVELIPLEDGYGYGKKIRLEKGQIPQLLGENVIELHYDKEAKGIKRTLNTDNLITKLYAYGSYGDYATGICDLKELTHKEYVYNIESAEAGTCIEIEIDRGAKRYFVLDEDIPDSTMIYSRLDYSSMSYVWNETTQRAYSLFETKDREPVGYTVDEIQDVPNNVDYLLNFTYYQEVGLMTDEMLQELAQYQREVPKLNAAAVEASLKLSEAQTSLSNIGQDNTGFLKLKVKRYENDNGDLRIEIDTLDNDGVIYRTDYAEKNFFTWHTAKNLKENGDPTSGSPSMVWILHKTEPVTFEQAYLKKIDERYQEITDYYGQKKTQTADYTYGISDGRPEKITLWSNYSDTIARLNPETDDVYLFCTNGCTGSLGAALASDEAAKTALETELKTVTLKHPVYFEDIRVGTEKKALPSSGLDVIISNPDGYGWTYLYNPTVTATDGDVSLIEPGLLFFCYHKDGDNQWYKAICDTSMPNPADAGYFFHLKKSMLYRSNGAEWTLLDPTQSTEYTRIGKAFAVVWKYCMRRDEIYKGKNEHYLWTAEETLTPGNYAMVNPYGFYWTFTTDRNVEAGHNLRIDVANNNVYQDEYPAEAYVDGKYIGDTNSIVETQAKQIEVIDFPADNEVTPSLFKVGTVNANTGVDAYEVGDGHVRTISIQVHDDTTYEFNFPEGSYIVLYDLNNNYSSSHVIGPNSSQFMPSQTGYMRIVAPSSIIENDAFTGNYYARVHDYENTLFVDKTRYQILSPVIGKGTNKGINNLIALYPQYADRAYLEYLPALLQAQQDIKDRDTQFAEIMHDTLKETRWQDESFVDGDEQRLYDEAMDNSYQIGKPEAKYEIEFLSLYESQGLVEDDDVPYPDVDVTDAGHLVDPEIDVNLWGYLDRVNKCYDNDWDTTIELNTELSTIAEHSFTDIMSYVADVAKQAKNKQSVWSRAGSLSTTGQLLAEKLEGTIEANKTLISGASANWRTDEQGRMIFENENGLYAMMLSGAGLMIADSKTPEGQWNWRTSMTGAGLSADSIVFGEMSGQRIQAHTITAEQVAASLGNELEIGSNVALTLYATKDGYRPAGSLDTSGSIVPKVEEDESLIQILPAGVDANGNAVPARIYIMSGGLTHIEGSTLELIANSTMDIRSGSNMNISSGGSLAINVSGENGNTGKFTLNSSNFQVTEQGDLVVKGNIDVYGGDIAGFRITDLYDNGEVVGTCMYIVGGVDSLLSTQTTGVYLGTDGLNIGGRLVMSEDGLIARFGTAKLNVNAVDGSINMGADSSVNITGGATVNIISGESLTFTTGGHVVIGNNDSPFTIGSDNARAYIYNGKTTNNDFAHDGVYVGTDGIIVGKTLTDLGEGGYFQALPDGTVKITGEISAASGMIAKWIIAANRLYSGEGTTYVALDSGTPDVDYALWAGNEDPVSANFRLSRTGNVTIRGGSITLKDGDTTTFSVSTDGSLMAIKGSIANWTLGADYIGSGTTKTNSQTGIANGTGSAVVFWAGHTVTQADMTKATFYVTADGFLFSTLGRMGGWYVGSDFIGNNSTLAASTVGMYSGNGTSFWAGGTQENALFKVTNGGHLTTTSASIGNWSVSGGVLTRTSSTAGNAGTITLGSDSYAINVNNVFTVDYTGKINATAGLIGGWTIDGTALYRAVPGKGYVSLGSATYALDVNGKFTVDYAGNTTIKSLKVDNETIDFSSFNNAVSLSSGGSWSGDTFTATVKLWGKINKNISMKASATPTEVQASAYDKATVWVTYSVNGVVKREEATSVPMDAEMVKDTVWADAADALGSEIKGDTFRVPYANGYGATTTVANNTEITGIFEEDSGTSGTSAYVDVVARTSNHKESHESFTVDCSDIDSAGYNRGYKKGSDAGYSLGYSAGYLAGLAAGGGN